jgi:hypothetical protein
LRTLKPQTKRHDPFLRLPPDAPLKELRELKGRVIDVKTTAAGDVAWEEALEDALAGDDGAGEEHDSPNKLKIDVPKWVGKYAVGMDAFEVR